MKSNLKQLLATLIMLVCGTLTAQTGQKWSTGGNTAGTGDFVGTTNSFPLQLKANNNEGVLINMDGTVKLKSLGTGSGDGLVLTNNLGLLSRLNFTNTGKQVLLDNGTWGALPVIPPSLWLQSAQGGKGAGTNIFYSSGFVGIGTSQPQVALDVNGDVNISGNLNMKSPVVVNTMLLTSRIKPLFGDSEIHFGDSSLVISPNYGKIYNDAVGVRKGIAIGAGFGQPLYSSNTGLFVGISAYTTGTQAYGFNSCAIGYNVATTSNAKNAVVIGSSSSPTTFLTNSIPNSLMIGFNTLGTPTFFIGPENANGTTTGNVGIGANNINPVAQLDVVTGNYPGTPSPFAIRNVSVNKTVFEVLPSGRTYIGMARQDPLTTTHPNAILSVSGEVVIGNSNGAGLYVTQQNWADFVFDSNYNLISLVDLEKYYTLNHHLPNVPTTKDIQEKGNNIGETEVILLQKIEELTLYLVEQQKQIEELKKKINK